MFEDFVLGHPTLPSCSPGWQSNHAFWCLVHEIIPPNPWVKHIPERSSTGSLKLTVIRILKLHELFEGQLSIAAVDVTARFCKTSCHDDTPQSCQWKRSDL